MERTAEERILGGLTHVAILLTWIGLIFNVVMLVLYRQKSPFIAGHARQALGFQIIAWVISWVLLTVFGVGLGFSGFGAFGAGLGVFMLGALIAAAVGIAGVVLIVIAAIKGFTGEEYRYPIIGDTLARLGR